MLTRSYPLITKLACMALLLLACQSLTANDAVFHIDCPPDVTIDCDDDTDDLSDYGWAYIYGYGDPYPAGPPVVHYYLNDCGTGHITRKWSASDYHGNVYHCTQYIYVKPGGGFDESNIHWPPDYHTPDCHANFHPDYLPHPYDYPTYDHVDCAQIMVGYEDQVFDFGGCKKVLRKWKVIDWCVYDPNHPYSGGRWEHTQILKVKPYGGHLQLDCPEDITVSANGDCSGAYVHLPKVTGVGACGSHVTVTNHSPYADHPGADASGFYPLGKTTVLFKAKDGCGNRETCKVHITVKDLKKPTPLCLNGITANLMVQPDGGYYIDVQAKWFDRGSFDNCTPKKDLKFDVQPKRFTCDELGRQDVKVFVTDKSGNTQFCNTYVVIQDNMGMCPPPDTASLSGMVTGVNSSPLEGVTMKLKGGSKTYKTSTDGDGMFRFDGIVEGPAYTLTADVRVNAADGISTFDLLYIAQYIIGLQDMDLPLQQVAADANMDGSINIIDLTLLRKLLLQTSDKLPHNHSWRFIAESELDKVQGLSSIHESIVLDDLDKVMDALNFVGVKLGDINNSAAGDGSVRNLELADVVVTEKELLPNEYYEIPVIVEDMNRIYGWQSALRFNGVSIKDVYGPDGLSLGNGLNVHADRGVALMSYIAPKGMDVDEGVLFTVAIVANKRMTLSEALALGSEMHGEIYAADKRYDIALKFSEDDTMEKENEGYDLSIFPNPFSDQLELRMTSENVQSVRLIDARGRVVYTADGDFQDNVLIIPAQSLPGGMYWIEVQTMQSRIIERVVKK